MSCKPVSIAVAGCRFGAAFAPIYRHHPDVAKVAVIDPDRATRKQIVEKFDLDADFESLDHALEQDYDAVHLVTPIPLHAEQAVQVLQAGRHCACTVPMATSIEDLRLIVAAVRASGKNYMMMETAVYTRHFLLAQQMHAAGQFGRIQLLRGAHYQDMENWPGYWLGLPPMWYATHAISPCLALADSRGQEVRCLGSGWMRPELTRQYGNPYPAETALFKLESGVAMEVTRTLFHVARDYTESFNIYGEEAVFEWPQLESEDRPVIFRIRRNGALENASRRGRSIDAVRVDAPDRQDLLPREIARFTVKGRYDDTNPQKTFEAGGGHHGSHPHLVHEFVRSIVEGRKPWIHEVRAANWTAAGICAHESALRNGECVQIPKFGP